MSSDAEPRTSATGSRPPWVLTFFGLACLFSAMSINQCVDGMLANASRTSNEESTSAWIRLILIVLGSFSTGIAVSMRPSSPRLLSLAFLASIFAYFGFHPAWDSGRIVAAIAAVVSGVAAILMALPRPVRRAGVSFLVLFHFAGILSAVSSPPSERGAWTVETLSKRVFRHYLPPIHMEESYQYYTDGAVPSSLLWMCIDFTSGDSRWFMLPRKQADWRDPMGLSFQRRWVLAAKLDMPTNMPPSDDQVRGRYRMSSGPTAIPFHPEISIPQQYRCQSQLARETFISSCIRHVCHEPNYGIRGGDRVIRSIKVYLVLHFAPQPESIQFRGFDSPELYHPYYVGEFDAAGNELNINDPLRDWLIPIFYTPKDRDVPAEHNPHTHPDEFVLFDGLKLHSNSDPWAK